jgi:outer membrane cobalamin receptor
MAAYRAKIGKHGVVKFYGNINRSAFKLNQEDLLHPEVKIHTAIKNQYNYLNGTFGTELKNNWNFYGGISFTHNKDDIEIVNKKIQEKDWGLHGKFRFNKDISDKLSINIGGEHYSRSFYQDYEGSGNDFRNRFDFIENLTATYIESDIRFSSSLHGRVGIRSEFRAQTNTMHVMPRVSVGLKTCENGQLSAAFGRFYQQPQSKLLMVANDLENEQATHYILNYQFSRNRRTFRVEGYHKRYDHLVKFDPEIIESPQGYNNQGGGFARGFDLFWRDSRTFSQVDYWISYSFLDTQRDYLDYPHSATPSFVSTHNLSIVYKHFIGFLKTQLGWTYTYASGRPYRNPNVEGFLTNRTKSYHDFSLNISYLMRENVIIHGSVTNVFGRNHVYGYTYSDQPNQDGIYPGKPITPPAKRFLFLGFFITLSEQQILNQLPNL